MWHPFIDEYMGFLDLTSLKKRFYAQQKQNKKEAKENISPVFVMQEVLQFIWSIFNDLENQTLSQAQKKSSRVFNYDEFVNPAAGRQLLKDETKFKTRASLCV